MDGSQGRNSECRFAVYVGRVPLWLIIASAFSLALIVRVYLMVKWESYGPPFQWELTSIAWNLASQGTYANPFSIHTGPTAHCPPGYVLLAAACYKIGGSFATGYKLQCLLNCLIGSVSCAVMPYLIERMGLSRLVGVTAAFIMALVPWHFLQEVRIGEGSFAGLLLMLLTAAVCAPCRSDRRSVAVAVVSGVLVGACGLSYPALLPCAAGFLLLKLYWERHNPRTVARFWLTVIAVGVAVMSPWAIRNYIVLGAPIFTKSTFGLELRVSFADNAAASFADNGAAFSRYHPYQNTARAMELQAVGEPAYYRRYLHDAVFWMWHHPTSTMGLITERIVLFWFPKTAHLFQDVFLWCITLLSFAGLAVLARLEKPAFCFIGVIWLLYPMVYYLVQSWSRYRIPIEWTFVALLSVLSVRVFFGSGAVSRRTTKGAL